MKKIIFNPMSGKFDMVDIAIEKLNELPEAKVGRLVYVNETGSMYLGVE